MSKRCECKTIAVVLGFIAAFLLPSSGYAYIDPGSTSLLYQLGFAFLALIFGGLLASFRFIKKLLLRFEGKQNNP